MGVVDDLTRAREAFERRDWVAAFDELASIEPSNSDPSAFATLATVAFLRGRFNDCVQALQRAYRAHLDAGDRLGALRCAFWLAQTLAMRGETAVAGGWTSRAKRLLDEQIDDVVETGYVRLLEMFQLVSAGDFGSAAEVAPDIERYGRRFDDPDLVAMGLAAQGRLLMYGGRVSEGLVLFDEAMTALTIGEVSAVIAGQVYCLMIEACQEISDLRRAAAWTAALTTWCDAQTGLVAFTGQCAVHRGQIMRLEGAYDEALAEFELAAQRYLEIGTEVAAGLTHAERGDLLRVRGEFRQAEAAYEQAVRYGYEAQPGMALLWLAQGRTDQAVAAARRLEAEARGPVQRVRLLPGLVEIFLGAGAVDEAAATSSELAGAAEAFGCGALQASSDHAAAAVALDRGDAREALARARRAAQTWNELSAPYERARCQVQMGRAMRMVDDEQSATTELVAARRTFAELGAKPAEAEVARLLSGKDVLGLSPREIEVLHLVAAGKSNREIAAALVVSQKTVARHVSNIFTKLDVTSRTAAAAYAFEHGLS